MWIIILLIITSISGSIAAYVFDPLYERTEKPPIKKEVYGWFMLIFFGIAFLSLLAIVLYFVGQVWYYLGGWLMVDCSDGFWDYVINGSISLIPLIGLLGFISVLGGWDPTKK